MAEVTRAAEVAAALERWREAAVHNRMGEVYAAGNEMARLLRESQPEPNPPTNLESLTEAETCVRCGNKTGKGTTPLSSVYYKGTGPLCGWCYDLMCKDNCDIPMPEPAPVVEHPEETCEICGRPNVAWFAPSAIWNSAFIQFSGNGTGVACPVCFIKAAERVGFNKDAWVVKPESYVDEPAPVAEIPPLTPESLRKSLDIVNAIPNDTVPFVPVVPAPVVGDDDAALLAKTQDWLCHNLTVTPDSHYRNVQALLERCSAALADLARVEARPSRYEDLMAIEQLQVQVDHYRTGMIESRAALAAAEQEKEKAVAEEREACALIAENSGEPFNDEIACATRQTALSVALKIRARAGRGDEQQK